MIEARLFAYRLLDALREDDPFWDLTSAIVPNEEGEACLKTKEDCVLAGVEEVVELLKLLGLGYRVVKGDGETAKAGECFLYIRGPKPDLLKVERVVLNLLMRASGIATATRRILEAARAANPRVKVAATRKTTPFLRYIEKKAVAIGGGDPHRFSLSDAVLIKDNHIKAVGGLERALELARKTAPFTAKIEVEVENVADAIKAAELGADIIMLDNMRPEEVAEVDRRLRERGLRERVVLEASGGIREDNAADYAKYVDVISVGALTHSVKAVDMSMELL
ncbi:carboxylating nicotinate-nucleotide diphosphorylase [Thermoproteus tenax]|uniref:Nicotinate-nucleotide pyrophosphorylase [carboxylating] n=1 Tax=Thermoproteus tenax (strain ATCC 35583 / DSM 2078 / JCM 9277 / NBRC 100435 / Kra 1) TaxID=768679 RepID=G4RN24_THETK|nr:carboxylating nicotinate-nucleotide diphosphorylase [Thermoproteus tenax]CCC80968.1 Nicotinate-nucleotide pyrophosphorylase [Thermoproteus tenax Kra 1]